MLWLYLLLIIFLLLILLFFFYQKLRTLKEQLAALDFTHRSLSVKHGQHWEQFVPFMKEFQSVANKDNFTFIGMPIDGICFDEDAIKFIEIKTGNGTLNKKQQQVKKQVQQKNVEWIELRY